jgi:hypothetical protein
MTMTTKSASELEHTIGRNGRFVLRLPTGEVTIKGVDGDVVRVRDTEGRALADRFEIGATDGALELVNRGRLGITFAIGDRSWGGGGSASLEIEVPATASVSVDGASTDIEASGLVGPKQFRTASGDLSLAGIAGELEIEAVSGDIRVDARGALEMRGRSISGDLRLRAPRMTRFEMTTTSGDIHLDAELSGKGPFSIKSISGDVTLVGRGGLQVEAQTITGDLASSLAHKASSGPGRKMLIIGKPGATLAFKSVSGDLQIVEPRDSAPSDDLVAPTPPTAPTPPAAPEPPSDPRAEHNRLEILRALERGDIDVETATQRLTSLES